MTPIRSLAELRARAAAAPPRRVAVAMAVGDETTRALVEARRSGLAVPVLFGPARSIRDALRTAGADPEAFEIVEAPDPDAATAAAVRAVAVGQADLLLKGSVPTATLVRAVLRPEQGLRTGRILSDVFLFDFRSDPEPRLVAITDGGVVPRPGRDEKAAILRNAVEAFRALGVERPRVALVAAVETVSGRFPSTSDAADLVRSAEAGEFPDCIVEGPMGLDLALSPAAVRAKDYRSRIAGRADILLFPDLESANLAAKSVEYTVPLEPAHAIVGATAPVLIPSRSETAEARLSSIAFGALLAAST